MSRISHIYCKFVYSLYIEVITMADRELEKARKRIDEIDAEMVKLFEERFNAVRDVISYKIAHHLPVLDADREDAIRKKNVDRLENEELRRYYLAWFDEMLALSREYQEEVKASH